MGFVDEVGHLDPRSRGPEHQWVKDLYEETCLVFEVAVNGCCPGIGWRKEENGGSGRVQVGFDQ